MKQRNLVFKNIRKTTKPAIHTDRKRAERAGYQKHKVVDKYRYQ